MNKFKFDISYVAKYLLKTKKILNSQNRNNIIKVQFFQTTRNNIVLCGINHVLNLLANNAIKYHELKILFLKDGSFINKNEPVLTIEGKLQNFIFLEGAIDGILARESSIATNAYLFKKAAHNKEIIYMNDRSDYFFTQDYDGYSANQGGISYFVTKAQTNLINENKNIKIIGTIPHALIQNYFGDLNATLKGYQKTFPNQKLVALVDYNNDVVNDSLLAAKAFKNLLWAIRIDTSPNVIDKSLLKYLNKYPQSKLKGVNSLLVKKVRKILDENNFKHVKIIVSSNLNEAKIKELEAFNSPIDYYGVGKAFNNIFCNFTCDAVLNNNIKESKYNRSLIVNKNLLNLTKKNEFISRESKKKKSS